jgi:hypothetical protein
MANGKDFLKLASAHIGEKYVFGASAPLNNPNYKGPWDCAEFASWIVFQASGKTVGVKSGNAWTGHWKTDAKTLCKVISIEEAAKTYGAILLRSPGYKDIKIGHIAFSDGNGGTLEAKNAKEGVTASKISGRQWEMGLLIKGITYETRNSLKFDYVKPPFSFRVAAPAMKHELVQQAKKALLKSGLYHGDINEVYDADVAQAVGNYQKANGITIDGILEKETISALKLPALTSLEKQLRWFKDNMGPKTTEQLKNTPFDLDLLTAIAYQETGYVWGRMIGKIPLNEILMNCTGDTIDSPGRGAFPKNKADLLAHANGSKMFTIARKALQNISAWDATYKKIFNKNPDKFCRGYGMFQYDLQFFKTNPDYFLNEKWGDVDGCIALAIQELKAAQKRIPSLKGKTSLTYKEKIFVAIAYNKGSANVNGSFKQGHKNTSDGKYYGENIDQYYTLAKTI